MTIILLENIYRILFCGRGGGRGHASDKENSEYLEMGEFHDHKD